MATNIREIIHRICYPGLVREIVIENEDLIYTSTPYLGVMIPTFNRPEYLKYTFHSLSISELDTHQLIFLIFDDGSSENTEQLIRNARWGNIPIIKIFTNRVNIVTQNEYTILPGNAFPFTIRYGIEILFELGAVYVMNSDSDAMFASTWLYTITETLAKMKDHYFILSGFRCDDQFHKLVSEEEDYAILASLGGINFTCNRQTFYDIVQPLIYDFSFDWLLSDACKTKSITIYVTNPSIVQHIGVNSSIIRGANNQLAECYECSQDNITLDKMRNLNESVKQLSDFPHADDIFW